MIADKKELPLRNMIHASGNIKEAAYEVALWFTEYELFEWEGVYDKYLE